ncbi:hypothetical protein PTKIN_Ptkin14bG0104100 [Pterospermum kingtungense]
MKGPQAFLSAVVSLAHSEMKHSVPLDLSSLITFSGIHCPPLELRDEDPGILSVTDWSGFPVGITFDSLSLTLMAMYNADEGGNCSSATVLKAGRNTITFPLPPQETECHCTEACFSKRGPADSDDFISCEMPTWPILKVFKPRPLVDISAESHSIEMESCRYPAQSSADMANPGDARKDSSVAAKDSPLAAHKDFQLLSLHNGKIEFPDWATDVTSIPSIPISSINDKLARGDHLQMKISQNQIALLTSESDLLVIGPFIGTPQPVVAKDNETEVFSWDLIFRSALVL